MNVGGLVASTLDIADADLAAGSRRFAGTGSAAVVNNGTLTAAPGGYIALLGSTVTNKGTLNAPRGTVALGAGSKATLDFNGDQLVKLAVDDNTVAALAANGGLIKADGGQVYLTAGARNSLVASVVNNTGVIEAQTVDSSKGTIVLLGGMAAGTTSVAGTLDASAPNGGDGGFIETSAAHVKIADGAKITTAAPAGKPGTGLIDPSDFTIASGSGALTDSGIGADTLSANLGTTDVKLDTSLIGSDLGNIFVNADISWSANQLTLSAWNNIYINANLKASGSGTLALFYGQGAEDGFVFNPARNKYIEADYFTAKGKSISLPAGDTFSTRFGGNGGVKTYTVITDINDLQFGVDGDCALGANIDASATSTWNGGQGFQPIGDENESFRSTFTGLGHTITGLTINRPSSNNVGLFGHTQDATIRDVGLVGGAVSGGNYVGGLVGWSTGGTINNTSSTGAFVSGVNQIGGLVGYISRS